jgi:succinoglycan biosynthesis transport protein ExoP
MPMPPLEPATGSHVPRDEEGILETGLRILRRHWLLVLQAIVLTTVIAVVLSASKPKQYTATSSVLLGTASESVLTTNTGYVDPNRQAATNENLLRLDVVAQGASRLLGGRLGAAEIAGSVAIVSEPEADLIDIQATTGQPRTSAAVANAYARAFINFRQNSTRRQLENAINLAKDSLATMTTSQRAGKEGDALRTRINQLETAKSLQTGGAELVQPAATPASPSSPKPKRDGVLGALLGAILGFALAALRERWDRRLRTVDELEDSSPWPVLARIPRSRALARGGRLGPQSVEAESLRMLRASLRYFSVTNELSSLLITSALPGEGKSTTARRLAETMAAMGDRVVLVAADMHRSPKALTGADIGSSGLSGALVGMDLDEVLEEVDVDGESGRTLTVLPSGPLPPNPSELLESGRMRQLMDELESQFEIVIVDSPPLPVLSDAITLVRHVSGIIVVSAVGRTTREDLRAVEKQVRLLRGQVLGLIANFAPGRDKAKEYYQR